MRATELAARIRRRELSPVEVVETFLERIDRHNPEINAYVTLLGEQARERAREAERSVASGEDLGPLHGVPVAIKDLSDFKAGVRNTFGSKPLAGFVPNHSAPYVECLEGAGAIVLGKTNTSEFGIKGTADNLLFGPTSTPFSLGKNSGGSSGGSAAAVADGLAALAQGTDGGGSVRIPASCCGVYGFKPTFGRIPVAPRPDAFNWHTPFIDVGVLARGVGDAALMLSVMAGAHPRDPHALPSDATDYPAATDRSIKGLRIAYSPALDVFPVDKSVSTVVGESIDAFRVAGVEVEEVELGLKRTHQELSSVWRRQIAVRCAAAAENFRTGGVVDLFGEHRDNLTPEFASLLEQGREIGAVEYKLDDVVRTEVLDALENIFEDYDLLATPTLSVSPFDNSPDGNTAGPSSVGGEEVDPLIGWCLTHPINFTGHPAASIPSGFTGGGLPVGMQLVGRRFAEETVLAVSGAFEKVKPWHDAYPPIREAARSRGIGG